jgi:hypothetical protein
LWQTLWDQLRPGEVLLGDRSFGVWAVLAQCGAQRVFHTKRKINFRQGQRRGSEERLVQCSKSRQRPCYLTREQWAALPSSAKRISHPPNHPGHTLLDPEAYPLAALGTLYYRRWEVELGLRNLKNTSQLERLSCKIQANVERELRLHFLVHNLARRYGEVKS